ncbi:hypothetical protein [Pseudomonas sp. QTF5]|uniref:hypothetical protein n=1 Tax=Pseudomonas sp. QTF5 TaxID=1435425 RepID=UPI00117AE202|nr:hypothetical protein [Pseudomonas sp. QTF5]
MKRMLEKRLRKRFRLGYAFFNKRRCVPLIGSQDDRYDNKKECPAMLHSGFHHLASQTSDALRTSLGLSRNCGFAPGSIPRAIDAFSRRELYNR